MSSVNEIACASCVLWHFSQFLDFSRKPPGSVEGPPGDSYVQDPKTRFSSCTAWRQGAVRQAIQTSLPTSYGVLGVSVMLDV